MLFEQLQTLISPKFTNNVFENILQKKSGLSKIQIKKITIGAESKKGDSYLSDIIRFSVDINGENQRGCKVEATVNVIVKKLLANISRRKTFRSHDFFENEIIFYEKVWPILDAFQKDKLQENDQFTSIPLVLATYRNGIDDFIALEDLSFQGFTSANREKGLDLGTTTSILHTFAQFHSLALACKFYQPNEYEIAAKSLKEVYCDEKLYNWYHGFQQSLIKVMMDAIEKELDQKYLIKFNELANADDFYQRMVNDCRKIGKLSAITHGDAWMPNFLMKYGKNKAPEKVAMIDFQLARRTCLINDITFFLFSCVDSQDLTEKWDDFISIYHKELIANLVKFKLEKQLVVTIDDLNQEVKNNIAFGIGMALEGSIASLINDDDVCNFDMMKGEEAVPLETVWVAKPFKSKEKRQRLAGIIKMSVDKQWF